MKQRIVFVLPSFDVGGAEKVTISIVRQIDPKDYAITLVVLNNEGPLVDEVPDYVEVISLETQRLRYSLFGIAKVLREVKPHFVFTTIGYINISVITIASLLRLKTKIVVREASSPSMYLSELPLSRRIIYRWLYRFLYPKAEIVVAQCDCMREDLVRNFGLDEDKVVRIYNPVDVDLVRERSQEFFPEEFFFNNVNIVAVGRLVDAKGYDVLLKAFSLLLLDISNAELFIIGDGPLKNALCSMAEELEVASKVHLLGFLANPYPYMKNADLYVLSSRREGFPNTVLEALACNTKVVASNCISGPAEILENNRYGILASVNDAESLSRSMYEYLMCDNRTDNRADAFSIANIGTQYQKLFK